MTILHATNRGAGFDLSNATSHVFSTSTGVQDAAYSDVALGLKAGEVQFATFGFSALAEGWFHFYFEPTSGTTGSDYPFFTLRNTVSNVDLLRLKPLDNVAYLQYWDGVAWVNIGSSATLTHATGHDIDVHWKIADIGGLFEWFMNGALIASFSGDTLRTAATGADQIRIAASGHTNGAGTDYFSQMILADEKTVGMKAFSAAIGANGTTAGWTGSNLDVDEPIPSDADFIAAASADLVHQFAIENLPAGTQAPRAVAVNARSHRGTTGPQNMNLQVRTGALDYNGPDKALAEGFGDVSQVWSQNPGTLAAWTRAEVDALEVGVRSRL